jgi:hypothetical protein
LGDFISLRDGERECDPMACSVSVARA